MVNVKQARTNKNLANWKSAKTNVRPMKATVLY